MIRNYLRRFSPRAWSNDQLKKISLWIKPGARIVNVGGWHDQDKEGNRYKDYFPTASQYHVANYPGDTVRGANVHSDLLIDLEKPLDPNLSGAYDVVFNHTVLEHVMRPWFAFAQLAALTSNILITVVPWKQKLHFEPGNFGDYFRFSPLAMRMLYEENGLKVLFEAYTPLPSLDVYLIHMGSKHPERYQEIQMNLPPVEKLNQHVGEVNAAALLQNIGARFLQKYVR